MNIENMIKEYKEIQVEIDILKEELKSIEVTGISAINYEGVGNGKTYSISRPVENEVIQMERIKEDIKDKIFVLEKRLSIIEKALEVLNETERTIIHKQLIDGEPYFTFTGSLHISERTAKRIKKVAISKMARIIGKWHFVDTM